MRKLLNNVVLNELISLENNRSVLNRSSLSDHGIWPSPTQSPVHKSLMEDPEKEERNANQGASDISTHSFKSTPRRNIVNDDCIPSIISSGHYEQQQNDPQSMESDHDKNLNDSASINKLENFIDNKSKELKASSSSLKYIYEQDPNMHLLYERLYQEQKVQIKTIQDLYSNTVQSLKEEILFLRNELQTRNNLIETVMNNPKNDKQEKQNTEHNVRKTYPYNHENVKVIGNQKQTIAKEKGRITNVLCTEKDKCGNGNNSINSSKVLGDTHHMEPKKYYYEFIGDSHLNNIFENGLRTKDRKVNIKRWQGGHSVDMLDILKPLMRKKPDDIIVHFGCNDITNNINYLANVKKMSKMVKADVRDTKLTFSSIIIRKDRKDIKDTTIRDINANLKNYCHQNDLGYIDNSNIDESHLGKLKLHLSKRGSSLLAKNIRDHMNQ